MPDIINCPSCQRKLQVPESLFGQDVQCPTCGATFIARGDSGPALAPPPPAPPTERPAYDVEGPPPERREPTRRPPSDYDDYDDYDDYRDRRRPRRRDMLPHRGSTILTMGILSLVLGPLGVIFGPIGWVMGNQDMVEIQAGRMDPEGEGPTNAGRICGIIGTVLGALAVLGCCIWFAMIQEIINAPHRWR
jgi:hypothetical protein